MADNNEIRGIAGRAVKYVKSKPRTVPGWRWNLYLPKQSPAWDRFVLSAYSLEPSPDFPAAKKQFPGATHEIIFFAVNPDLPEDEFAAGAVAPLEPLNYLYQWKSTNAAAAAVVDWLAPMFVSGLIPAEPGGVSGAFAYFRGSVDLLQRKFYLRN